MADLQSFSDIIDLWENVVILAEDIGEKYPTVAAWKQRDKIPAPYWEKIILAADVRGYRGVTWEVLGRLASRESPRQRQRAS